VLELTSFHLDDFTLLRYVAEDLDEGERASVARHLEMCRVCQKTVAELMELDDELRTIAADPDARRDLVLDDLPEGDPFRRRPTVATQLSRFPGDSIELSTQAIAASEEGSVLSSVLLESVGTSSQELDAVLGRIDLSDSAQRFALLYALQEAGRRIAEGPVPFLKFADQSLEILRPRTQDPAGVGESSVPTPILLGQSHFLAGQGHTWTGDFERAGTHFALAYRFFSEGGVEETTLAMVEYQEGQRRSFVARGGEGVILARRALSTFEAFGMEDFAARARVAEGLALSNSGSPEEAISVYRLALPVFERKGLWSNYVGVVNSLGTALQRLGRLDEARREYARALRRMSRREHRSWVAFVRHGLADVLFAAERFREAATAMGQAIAVYRECGLSSNALIAALFEVECWARAGNVERAQHRLAVFAAEVAKLGVLDLAVGRKIQDILTGQNPNYELLSELRRTAQTVLAQRLSRATA
jgi:tetratricopeptide (TPR) repeat protein